MRPETISQIGTFTNFDPGSADDAGCYLNINPAACSGCSDAPLRTTVEDAPGQDGALIFPPFDDAQIITLAGTLVTPDTTTTLDSFYATFKAAIDALKTAPDDLVHSAGTVKVWKYAPIDTTSDGITFMTITFNLVVDVFAS